MNPKNIGFYRHRRSSEETFHSPKAETPGFSFESVPSKPDSHYISSTRRVFLHSGKGHSYEKDGTAPFLTLGVLEKGKSEQALLLHGLFVPEHMRGQGFGGILMETFFRIAEVLDLPPTTSTIRKPLIAKLLLHYGFSPQASHTLAEILPRDPGSTVPTVRLRTEKTALKVLHDSWFTPADGDVDESSGNPLVSIYTRYHLRNPAMALNERIRATTERDGLVRIFPNRVQKAFRQK